MVQRVGTVPQEYKHHKQHKRDDMRQHQILIVTSVDIVRIEEEDRVDAFEYFSSIGVICYGRGDEGRDECE